MIIVPGATSYTVAASAALLGEGDHLQAWAERHVRKDPDLRWILGNYVEADEPNNNGHIFPLADLVTAQETIAGKPLNMLHRTHYIVGAYAGAQLLDDTGVEITAENADLYTAAQRAGALAHPRVEALAGMWHQRFPEEFFNIQRAHKEGSLYFSMESIPETVTCPTCDHEAEFAGTESSTYCDHMQGATGPKRLNKPHFAGGAIIIPPVKPGWSRADITAISRLIEDHAEEAGAVYAQIEGETPHLGPKEWELVMALLLESREFNTEQRKKAADKGHAMPDGSFPIKTVGDLRNAIQAIGRAKNPGAAKSHIIKRAKQLGRTDLIPPGW